MDDIKEMMYELVDSFVGKGEMMLTSIFSSQFISSDSQGSHDRIVKCISHTMTVHQTRRLSVLSGGNILTCSKFPTGQNRHCRPRSGFT